MSIENGRSLTMVRFVGDIRDANYYGPEAVEKLEVGATVTSGLPGDSSYEYRVTEVTRGGEEIIARVESKGAGRAR